MYVPVVPTYSWCDDSVHVVVCRLLDLYQYILDDIAQYEAFVGGRAGDGMDAGAGVGTHATRR